MLASPEGQRRLATYIDPMPMTAAEVTLAMDRQRVGPLLCCERLGGGLLRYYHREAA